MSKRPRGNILGHSTLTQAAAKRLRYMSVAYTMRWHWYGGFIVDMGRSIKEHARWVRLLNEEFHREWGNYWYFKLYTRVV